MLNAADHGVITFQDDDRNVLKANGQRLKILLEPKISELEEVDVYDLSELYLSPTVVAVPTTCLILG